MIRSIGMRRGTIVLLVVFLAWTVLPLKAAMADIMLDANASLDDILGNIDSRNTLKDEIAEAATLASPEPAGEATQEGDVAAAEDFSAAVSDLANSLDSAAFSDEQNAEIGTIADGGANVLSEDLPTTADVASSEGETSLSESTAGTPDVEAVLDQVSDVIVDNTVPDTQEIAQDASETTTEETSTSAGTTTTCDPDPC